MQTTKVRVQAGQYEQACQTITIRHNTDAGLLRRCRQLAREHAVHGDNWAGWLNASVAIADPADVWHKNSIIGGSSCEPINGWMDLQ
jgi:hypothetical protein